MIDIGRKANKQFSLTIFGKDNGERQLPAPKEKCAFRYVAVLKCPYKLYTYEISNEGSFPLLLKRTLTAGNCVSFGDETWTIENINDSRSNEVYYTIVSKYDYLELGDLYSEEEKVIEKIDKIVKTKKEEIEKYYENNFLF